MEELLIEEKAKAYDEAIERAKSKIKNDKDHVLYENDIIDIFPALKESEDEKIRKALIRYFTLSDEHAYNEACGVSYRDIVTWLEKRGEQKQDVNMQIESSEYINDMGGNGCYLKNDTQKPADKVEPKFKIEEEKWYVCTKTYVLRGKIVVIKGQTYQSEKDNVIKGENGYLFIDRHDGKALDYFRSWTIQDAKDGDILVNKDGLAFIYNGYLEEQQYPFAYGGINLYSRFNFCDGLLPFTHQKVHPATKEQRNSLFQKIHEAGYTWDAEKKELKKEKVDNLHNYLYGEQNSTWSKEDDYVIERLFCLLHNEQDKYPQQSSEFQELEEIGNKLMSFKERVQPKVELTQLDKNILEAAIAFVEQNNRFNYWRGVDKHTVLSALNSLRPQSTWNPSKEEIVALEHAINCYSSISPTNTNEVFILEIMKERLKNLTK